MTVLQQHRPPRPSRCCRAIACDYDRLGRHELPLPKHRDDDRIMQEPQTGPQAQQDQPNPGAILAALNAYQVSAALRGAIELELFTAVARGDRTAEKLAGHCHADDRGMRILCDFLVVHGFLTKSADEYALTPESALFLDGNSPQYLGSMAKFMHSAHLVEAFRDVAEIVRQGHTLLGESGTMEAEHEVWVEFAQSMVPLMMPAAQFIGQLAAQRTRGAVRVLDIAAGHGMFGISVAQQNPEASVVALDWPNVLEVAQENARQAGIEDRYELLPGDALELDYETGFDVVLVTNFFHHFDTETCVSVMRKIRSALSEDGFVLTLEFVPNEDRVSPHNAAAFAFTMLGTTPAGDVYTFGEYDAMWRQVGMVADEMIDVPHSAQQVILTSR